MNQSFPENEILHDFILDYSDGSLEGGGNQAFRELMDSDCRIHRAVNTNRLIPILLSKLPRRGVSDRFDRKMAAAFALELEKEVNANQKQKLSRSNELIR
jgi:hypothetical protein